MKQPAEGNSLWAACLLIYLQNLDAVAQSAR